MRQGLDDDSRVSTLLLTTTCDVDMQSDIESTRVNLDGLQDWLTRELASQVQFENAKGPNRIVNFTRRSE
jgi:hypothetical protein